MKIKRTCTFILLIIVMGICSATGFTACSAGSKSNPNNLVNYNGIDYVLQEDIALNFTGYTDFFDGLDNMCEKTGSFRQADVYKINGLESGDWIFIDNSSMLSSNGPYGGIYRSSKVMMNTIVDFKPDSLVIDYLTPPTSEQSGTSVQWFNTKEKEVINKIIAAIEKGRTISPEKQADVAKAIQSGDSRYQTFRLEFSSESYPNLVYRLDYTEEANGKCYIGHYGDDTAYRILEVDNTLHEYLAR